MKKLFAILLLLLSTTTTIQAQKVAVVLSGGGSKGAAHIGVLKALEENQIPIDYITGTSIGAIVGGLYANGWSPKEIEDFIASQKFTDWAKGTIDEQYVYFFKQPEENASWASFRINVDSIWNFELPTSIVSPGQMDFIFMEIFAQANAVCKGDFDSLFVPFRCIGANITDSRAEIFRSGNLIKAIRASMTYPFYFKPITIKDKLYMDGGMYNNFPADVALKDFDPDIIIGSKVAQENAIPNPDNILSQIENIFMAQTSYDLPCNSSVLIEPPIPTTNVIDFSKTSEFIQLGYDATIEKIPEIRKFVIDSISVDEVNEKRINFNNKKAPLVFNDYEVSGLNKSQKKYVLNYFPRKDTANIVKVRKSYLRLLTDHAIQNIYPMSSFNDTSGYFSLNLDVKKESNIVLKFGGLISSNPINEAFAEINYKHFQRMAITTNANLYAGRFYSSGLLGLRLDFPSLPQYALYGRIILNQWDYFRTTSHFFEDKTPSYLVTNDNHWDCGIIFPARNKGKITLNGTAMLINNEYFQENSFRREDIPDKTKFRAWSVWSEWERNTLNKKQYANKGTLLKFSAGFVYGRETTIPGTTSIATDTSRNKHKWFYSEFTYDNFFLTVKKFRLGWYFNAFYSNQAFFSNYTATALFAKAFSPMPEMNTIFMPQYRAHGYGSTGLKSIYKFKEYLDFRLEAYLCQPIRDITRGPSDFFAQYGKLFNSRYFVASSSIVFHSPIGPAALMLSYYDKHTTSWMFSFYLGYTIFNPKALR